MIGPYRNVVTVGEAYQDAAKQFADIQNRQADTQLLNIKTLLGQNEIVAQQRHQQAVEQYMRLNQQLDQGPINQANPLAPAVADKMPSWWTPVDQSVMDLTKDRDKLKIQVDAARNLDLPEEVRSLRPIYDNTITRLREASKEQAVQRETQFKQTAQLLNGAQTAEQITAAMDAIKDKMPPQVWQNADSRLLHNPDGSYLWNDQQAQRLAQLGSQYMTVAEQHSAKYHDARLGQIAEEEARKKENDAARRYGADSRAAGGQAGVAGGGPLKAIEYIYPRKEDGSIDESSGPIGTRGVTKDGKMVVLDANGQPTTLEALGGGTEKERKATTLNVQNATRNRLVQGAAKNAMDRLDEIEKKYPKDTTSVLFSMHPEGLTESVVAAAIRGQQKPRQQEVDQQWRSFIDEAIPVFTGGLRGSDAFRRFLISQAPNWGATNNAQIIDLFKKNITGMDRAFSNNAMTAYASDPKFWAPGVTKDQVDAAMKYVQSQTGNATGAGDTSTIQTGAEPTTNVNLKNATPKDLEDLAAQLRKDAKNKPVGSAPANAAPVAGAATGKPEIRVTPDGRVLQKNPDGTVKELK